MSDAEADYLVMLSELSRKSRKSMLHRTVRTAIRLEFFAQCTSMCCWCLF